MIKRTLHFSNPAYLSLKDQQLEIELKAESKTKKLVPIEDIGVMVLEHPQITITHTCMAALLVNNVALITCDSRFHPVGLLLPLDGAHTQSERFRYQIEASQPLKKNLWQQTIQAKILNQAAVLFKRGVAIDNMLHWARAVRSGDPDNYEGRAAAYYWQNIFPSHFNFRRDRNGLAPNNLLNYGYAILRAIVARGLVSSGLLPTLGIHHKNKYNAYCLADDIMEPYRPYVDELVLQIMDKRCAVGELTKEIKAVLLSIAVVDVQFERGTSPLMVGLQQTTASLAKCYEGVQRKINYPQMMSFDKRNYYQWDFEKEELPRAEADYPDGEDEELPF